jgi:hypothetical protein
LEQRDGMGIQLDHVDLGFERRHMAHHGLFPGGQVDDAGSHFCLLVLDRELALGRARAWLFT